MKYSIRATLAMTLAVGSWAAVAQEAGFPGFAISLDDTVVAGERQVADAARAREAALAGAEIDVIFDGLDSDPVLSLVVLDAPARPRAGDRVRVASRLNYPAFVTRGELRIFASDGGRLRAVGVVPIAPNGEAVVTLPPGQDFALSHRVYDARGRYDETFPQPLVATDAPGGRVDGTPATAQESDTAQRRRIPLHGGTVVVSGNQVRDGARVSVLGETLRPDPDGQFVINRILPPGEVPVSIAVDGAGENTRIERIVSIPRSEWFYVGLADLTFGKRLRDRDPVLGVDLDSTYAYGRLAGYAKGRLASGWTITSRFDSGEEDLDELFEARDDQDAAALLDRLDYDEQGYSEFGDDSEIVDGAPSRGKFYLKAEREGSSLLWGDFRNDVDGARFLRNARTLYGGQLVYRSTDTTARGEARVTVEAYAAQPERLPGRDVFRGTGGSVYFLRQQDISVGTETVSIELRDSDSDRLISSRPLVAGQDYDINFIQGVVVLDRPLQSSADTDALISQPGGRVTANLVVQYEYTPVGTDLDGYAYGGRAAVWASDDLRLGVTGMVERTASADQTATGADLHWRLGDQSFVQLDYARTDGPGFGATLSATGGIDATTVAPVGGDGDAVAAELSLDFADLGLSMPGSLTGFYERRARGFSTLDQQILVDDESWGIALDMAPGERIGWKLYADAFRDDDGTRTREAGVELAYAVNDRTTLELGIERVDRTDPDAPDDETGARTDLATRLTLEPSHTLRLHVFGQVTTDRAGGLRANNRAGVGVGWEFAEHWTIDAEVSGGNLGAGGEVLLGYDNGTDATGYVGYRLEPGRDFGAVELSGRDRGQLVAGGTRKVNDRLGLRAESTYDLFGDHRALVTGYGVDFEATSQLSFGLTSEVGRIEDARFGDVDRDALSLEMRYEDGDWTQARARLELRRDRGVSSGVSQDLDAALFTADANWKLDEAQRLSLALDYADIDGETGGLADGTYVEAGIGYALRPVRSDRLNLLFQYRYLRDLVGQDIDGVEGSGPVQKTHILSVDGEYDLSRRWSLGAKIGGRWSESAPNAEAAFADNDAWLGVLNARWHVVKKWDFLLETRYLKAEQGGFRRSGVLGALYRHVGDNAKIGLGYNFGSFSDDLADLTYDDEGIFLNVIGKF